MGLFVTNTSLNEVAEQDASSSESEDEDLNEAQKAKKNLRSYATSAAAHQNSVGAPEGGPKQL